MGSATITTIPVFYFQIILALPQQQRTLSTYFLTNPSQPSQRCDGNETTDYSIAKHQRQTVGTASIRSSIASRSSS